VYSSTIAVEVSKHGNTAEEKTKAYQLLQDSNWAKNYQTFWPMLKKYTPQISNFEILGGEPLMWPENLNFMQYLIDSGQSKQAIFEFITNGTQYPAILDQAGEFRRLTITVSIDNIGTRFEYERSGADWALVEHNINRFVANKNQNKSLRIGVCITVNIQNVFYLPELIGWLNDKKIDHYYYNFLNFPDYLCIDRLTPIAKQLVLDKLKSTELLPKDRTKLDYIVNRLQDIPTSDGGKFCQYMKEKDRIRNENFSISHKEIANAMGYVLN
jgi:MoaA/NifB/PqqE/SkfB family radical SAM enzyme